MKDKYSTYKNINVPITPEEIILLRQECINLINPDFEKDYPNLMKLLKKLSIDGEDLPF